MDSALAILTLVVMLVILKIIHSLFTRPKHKLPDLHTRINTLDSKIDEDRATMHKHHKRINTLEDKNED